MAGRGNAASQLETRTSRLTAQQICLRAPCPGEGREAEARTGGGGGGRLTNVSKSVGIFLTVETARLWRIRALQSSSSFKGTLSKGFFMSIIRRIALTCSGEKALRQQQELRAAPTSSQRKGLLAECTHLLNAVMNASARLSGCCKMRV